jgi:hypothetical protein
MEAILLFIASAILLDIAARRWSADTTEGLNSSEWQRRTSWNLR